VPAERVPIGTLTRTPGATWTPRSTHVPAEGVPIAAVAAGRSTVGLDTGQAGAAHLSRSAPTRWNRHRGRWLNTPAAAAITPGLDAGARPSWGAAVSGWNPLTGELDVAATKPGGGGSWPNWKVAAIAPARGRTRRPAGRRARSTRTLAVAVAAIAPGSVRARGRAGALRCRAGIRRPASWTTRPIEPDAGGGGGNRAGLGAGARPSWGAAVSGWNPLTGELDVAATKPGGGGLWPNWKLAAIAPARAGPAGKLDDARDRPGRWRSQRRRSRRARCGRAAELGRCGVRLESADVRLESADLVAELDCGRDRAGQGQDAPASLDDARDRPGRWRSRWRRSRRCRCGRAAELGRRGGHQRAGRAACRGGRERAAGRAGRRGGREPVKRRAWRAAGPGERPGLASGGAWRAAGPGERRGLASGGAWASGERRGLASGHRSSWHAITVANIANIANIANVANGTRIPADQRAKGRPARRPWPRRLPSALLQCSGHFASRAGG
jgi:hypothetical protein